MNSGKMKLKQLKYKSIKELEGQIDVKQLLKTEKENDGHTLIQKYEQLSQRTEKDVVDKGDQEKIYLNYCQLNILRDAIKKSKIYLKDRKYCELMIGDEKFYLAIKERFINLRKSLIDRYEQEKENLNFKSDFLSSLPNESNSLSTSNYLKCKQFYYLLDQLSRTNKNQLLLIDIRRKSDFSESSISFNNKKMASSLITINIPEDKILKGFTCQNIESILNPNESNQFKNRNQAHNVVLMDYESTSFRSNDKLNILYQAITKFDTTPNRLENEPLLLEGGFKEWKLTYPMHQTLMLNSSTNFDRNLDFQNGLNNNNDYSSNKFNNYFSNFKKDSNLSIPGLAKFMGPTTSFDNSSRNSSNFSNNLSNNFGIVKETESNKKVIIHKINIENEDKETFFSKPIAEIKNDLLNDFDNRADNFNNYGDASNNFSNNNRFAKSFTNLTEFTPEDDIFDDNDQYSPYINKPNFDRSIKPPTLLDNDLTRPSSTSTYRNSLSNCSTSYYYPIGLVNLGNSCFMNAVIQCLFNVKDFLNYFIEGNRYLNDINCNSKFGTKGELTREFGSLMKKMVESKSDAIEPRRFRDVFHEHILTMEKNVQQDSHEFLLHLFEKLHADLNKGLQIIKSNLEIPDSLLCEEATDRFWQNHVLNNKSIISNLFEGLIMSTLECETCKKKSNTFEVFTFLSLPVTEENLPVHLRSSCLDDLLKAFTKTENMCDEAAWQCPTCKVKRSATKKTSIVKLPKVLIIHLKRFGYNEERKVKITKFVNFEKKNFNLRQHITYSDKPSIYDLIGVVNHHSNTTEGGHYTAYCKYEFKDEKGKLVSKWNKYDDERVDKDVPDERVVSNDAYLLFYVQSI